MAGDRAAFEEAVKKAHGYAWDKRWMEAIEQYELALAEFPDDPTARGGLAFAYLKGQRLREALREYRKVSELRAGDPSPVGKIAEILEQLGRRTDAVEAWMGVAELLVHQKDLTRAIEAWRQAVRLQPGNREAHRKLAEGYSFKSDTAAAVGEYLSLARLCNEAGETAQATEHCQAALSLDGRNREARALLGHLASDGELGNVDLSLVLRTGQLGPIGEAVQRALTSLAEAVLDETGLIELAEPEVAEGTRTDSPRTGELEACTALGRAIDCHSRGIVEDALGYYQQSFDMGVRRVAVVFNLGLLYQEASRFEEAIDLLERSLDVSEYCLASHLALGECYWAQGRVDQALDHFLEALRIVDLETIGQDRADDIAELYEDYAEGYEIRGGGQPSERFVDALTDFFSQDDWKRRLMEVRQKLDSLGEDGVTLILPDFLEVPGGDQVLELIAASGKYLGADMPFTALEECYRAIEKAPTYLPLHLRLAEIFARQGKVEEAVSKYAAVAESYLMRHRPHKAIEVYRRTLRAAPMSTSIREKFIDLLTDHGQVDLALEEYLALGESYYRLARVDEALAKYEEALSLVSRSAAPNEWQIRILHRMADLDVQRVQWKRAAATYEKIKALSPDDEEANLSLVELRYKLGQEDVAMSELDRLIVRYGKEERLQGLIGTLRDLVDSRPQDIPLRSRLSRIYIEVGMKEEGIAELDTLGELQLEAGRKRDALETLRTIVSLEPEEKEGYMQLLSELSESLGEP